MIEQENLLDHARQLSQAFHERLTALAAECSLVKEVRVLGLMIGVELAIDGAAAVQAAMERGLLINCTHNTVLRLLPAMNLGEEQLHDGCDILAEVLKGQAA
jgi:acetylornithine/succinyldiaminopimelate/putrescine aminotransferase